MIIKTNCYCGNFVIEWDWDDFIQEYECSKCHRKYAVECDRDELNNDCIHYLIQLKYD